MDFNILLHSDRPSQQYLVQQYNPDGFPTFVPSQNKEGDTHNVEELIELLADLKLSEQENHDQHITHRNAKEQQVLLEACKYLGIMISETEFILRLSDSLEPKEGGTRLMKNRLIASSLYSEIQKKKIQEDKGAAQKVAYFQEKAKNTVDMVNSFLKKQSQELLKKQRNFAKIQLLSSKMKRFQEGNAHKFSLSKNEGEIMRVSKARPQFIKTTKFEQDFCINVKLHSSYGYSLYARFQGHGLKMNDILRKVTARKVLHYFLKYSQDSSVSKLQLRLFNYTISVKQELNAEQENKEPNDSVFQTLVQYLSLKQKPIQDLYRYFFKLDLIKSLDSFISLYNEAHPNNQIFKEIFPSSSSLNIEIIVKKGTHRRTLVALLYVNQKLELSSYFYGNLGCLLPSSRLIVTSLSQFWRLLQVQLGGFIKEEENQR